MLKTALKEPAWKRFTNAPIQLLPSWRDAEDKSRAKSCIDKHKAAMANLAWATSSFLINPDHTNKAINLSRPPSLRDLVMDMETTVEVVRIKEGQRVVKKVKDKLFQSMDEMFGDKGEWIFVFPKAYETEAKNVVTGLYVYIRHIVMEINRVPQIDAEGDIAIWFKPEAAKEAEGMTFAEGRVITEEMLHQSEAINILEEVPWFVGSQSPAKAITQDIPRVEKAPRRFDPGDTASIQTQHTTATRLMSQELMNAIDFAREMAANDAQSITSKVGISGQDGDEGSTNTDTLMKDLTPAPPTLQLGKTTTES